jgi:response regulator RpfG family c-di-GMP phosphodiesterase
MNRDPFDAIVLDYKMPILDGIQVAKEIIRLNPRQRIIIATGQVKETLYNSIRELGHIIEIILKPFEPELLVEVIEDTLTSARIKELDATTRTTYSEKDLDSQIDKLLYILKTIQRQGTL